MEEVSVAVSCFISYRSTPHHCSRHTGSLPSSDKPSSPWLKAFALQWYPPSTASSDRHVAGFFSSFRTQLKRHFLRDLLWQRYVKQACPSHLFHIPLPYFLYSIYLHMKLFIFCLSLLEYNFHRTGIFFIFAAITQYNSKYTVEH